MEEQEDPGTLLNLPFLASSLWALNFYLMCQLHWDFLQSQHMRTSFKTVPLYPFLSLRLPDPIFFRLGGPNETTLWASTTLGTKLYKSFSLCVVILGALIDVCVCEEMATYSWVTFLFFGCSIYCIFKILLDCSDDLKVKKTLDEEILGVLQRIIKGSCCLTAGEGQASHDREPRTRWYLPQISCLPSCSSFWS